MTHSDELLWGIDLGGTKIEGVVLRSADNPEVLTRVRVPTERDKGYDQIIEKIGSVINSMAQETGQRPQTIGIGTPGITDPSTGLLKNSNTVVLNQQPFHRDLQDHLGIEVAMTNDANCFALAETRMGIVKEKCPEAKMVFGVIMGTGVGGGLVINGTIWNGRTGIGGEWGHNYLDSSGGLCYCGKTGCVEKVISGPSLEHFYFELSGKTRSLKEIYKEYNRGEAAAIKCIDRLLHFFALGISNVLNIVDPDVIVLGGGVGNIELLYTEGVRKINDFIFNDRVETIFLKPKLGDSAGVFGAAFLTADK